MKHALIAGLVALGAHSCDDKSDPPPAEPARPQQVILIPEDYSARFTAEAGDVLVLIMNPDGGQLERCDHYGGELIYNPYTLIYVCEYADF